MGETAPLLNLTKLLSDKLAELACMPVGVSPLDAMQLDPDTLALFRQYLAPNGFSASNG